MDIEEYLAELREEEYLAELREEEYFAELKEIAKAISDAHQPITKIDHSQYWCIVSIGEEK